MNDYHQLKRIITVAGNNYLFYEVNRKLTLERLIIMSIPITWINRSGAGTVGCAWSTDGVDEEAFIDLFYAPPLLSLLWGTSPFYKFQILVAYWDHDPSPTEIANGGYNFWSQITFEVGGSNTFWVGETNFVKSGYYAFVLTAESSRSDPSSAIGISGSDYGPPSYPLPFPPLFGPGPQGGPC